MNEFNLSFHQPRSDICSPCNSDNSNEKYVENYHTPLGSMKADRELAHTSDKVAYITIDLYQISLYLNSLHYKRSI